MLKKLPTQSPDDLTAFLMKIYSEKGKNVKIDN